MIFIESLAKEFAPELCQHNKLSTVCISTSNPVYLIFTKNKAHPEVVIRISETEEICLPHKVIEEIYKEAGDLVPEPLVLTKSGTNYISIQKGLKGTPWFQLATNHSNLQYWDSLRNRAINSLNELHNACQPLKHWETSCKPGTELQKCYKNCISSGLTLPTETEPLVSKLAKTLDELGTITTYPQHGDFCLNNLIIDDEKIYIIDFEDFGLTSMPLHDQFTLALSFYLLSPSELKHTLHHELNYYVMQKHNNINLNKDMTSGLFLHHLLLRLGSWSKDRATYRKWLLTVLTEFINTHESFFN